ncbi:MAG: hypothetical protein ABSA85_05210 [Terracidiphilus sp.]|jgi:hypothetical protein
MTTERFARQLESKCAHAFFFGRWALLAGMLLHAALPADAQAGGPGSQAGKNSGGVLGADQIMLTNARVTQWARDNVANFTTYTQFAKQESKRRDILVPPQVDPPCQVCGDDTKTPNETAVDNWIKQVTEPETTYMKGLAKMAAYMEVNIIPFRPVLTVATDKALYPFYNDPANYLTDANTMAQALVDRVEAMAQKYDKDPTRAYAGIKCLLTVEQALEMVADPDPSGHNATLAEYDYMKAQQQRAIQLAAQWASAVVDAMDDAIFKNHKYNLCPVYAALVQQLLSLGGENPNDSETYAETLQKIQNYLDFDVGLTLKVNRSGDDGTYLHATWNGTATLQLKIDMKKTCYTPEFEDGQVKIQVTNFDGEGLVNRNGADAETLVPMSLTSPHTYTAKVGTPQLDLCDEQPTFQMPTMNWQIPPEVVTVNGFSAPAPMLTTFLAALTVTNKSSTDGADSAPEPDDSAAQNSQAEQNAEQIAQKYQNDPAGAIAAEQQLVLQSMQQSANQEAQQNAANQAAQQNADSQGTTPADAMQAVRQTAAANGIDAPLGNNLGEMMQSLMSVHVPWTNMQLQPVNKTLHLQKDNLDETLNITVTLHQPQK